MLVLRDEEWAQNILRVFLKPEETLVSVGKAIRKRWGLTYYTGFTNGRVIFLRYTGVDEKRSFSVPLKELEIFLRRKRIELLPFSSPFLSGERAWRIFERLRQIAESHIDEDDHLRTIARANYRLSHYCLAFFDDKVVASKITRMRCKERKYEVIPLPDIQDICPFSKRGDTSLEVPFQSFAKYLKMLLMNGDVRLYAITSITGLKGPGFYG